MKRRTSTYVGLACMMMAVSVMIMTMIMIMIMIIVSVAMMGVVVHVVSIRLWLPVSPISLKARTCHDATADPCHPERSYPR